MGYMSPCLSKTKRKPKSFIVENSLSWFRKTQRRASVSGAASRSHSQGQPWLHSKSDASLGYVRSVSKKSYGKNQIVKGKVGKVDNGRTRRSS